MAERFFMSIFGTGASTSGLYNTGTKMAATLTKPITKDGKITKGIGPLKNWLDIREFPAPKKQRFRDWFDQHEKERD